MEDVVHLMMFNLSLHYSRNYFDLANVIGPYIKDNWHALQLPPKVWPESDTETIRPAKLTKQIHFDLVLSWRAWRATILKMKQRKCCDQNQLPKTTSSNVAVRWKRKYCRGRWTCGPHQRRILLCLKVQCWPKSISTIYSASRHASTTYRKICKFSSRHNNNKQFGWENSIT